MLCNLVAIEDAGIDLPCLRACYQLLFRKDLRRVFSVSQDLSKLCSVEQHFNHIDETLASWKRRRISKPAMNLRLTIPPTVI